MLDAVVIGAGPAGLAAALTITEERPGAAVLVVERGRTLRKRHCPVDVGRRCKGCGGICNVISGFGGSMHYGDGVKLSLLPSGRRLIDLFGEDAYDLSDEAFDLVSQQLPGALTLVGHQVPQDVLDVFDAHALFLRQYPVAVLSESELQLVLDGFLEEVSGRTDLRLETDVVDIRERGGGYEVTLQERRKPLETVAAENVIVATGRAGLVSMQRLLRRLDVPMTPPDYSIGVRFEMTAEYLRATGLSHPDMKVSQRKPNAAKVKTFCFCGGTNGGRVKFTNYQDAFGGEIITLDGHESLERVPGDRPLAGNFGLLCQSTTLDGGVDASSRLEERVLAPYRSLNDGRPVVQTLADFRRRRDSGESWEELHASLPFEPSVHDLAVAPVHSLFDERQLTSLVDGFDHVMGPILELGGFPPSHERFGQEVLVIGLELEFLWSRVAIDDRGETERRGLFVTGDAAGIAQGVIQAMMMGLRAGRAVARSPEPAAVPS